MQPPFFGRLGRDTHKDLRLCSLLHMVEQVWICLEGIDACHCINNANLSITQGGTVHALAHPIGHVKASISVTSIRTITCQPEPLAHECRHAGGSFWSPDMLHTERVRSHDRKNLGICQASIGLRNQDIHFGVIFNIGARPMKWMISSATMMFHLLLVWLSILMPETLNPTRPNVIPPLSAPTRVSKP